MTGRCARCQESCRGLEEGFHLGKLVPLCCNCNPTYANSCEICERRPDAKRLRSEAYHRQTEELEK
jgi:hypothetical protein